MTFSTAHFAYGTTQSIGDTAIAYSLTAARWAVLAYDAVTCDRAVAAYRQGWQFARCTALFFIGLGILSRRAVQDWADSEAEASMVDPFDPSVNPLPAAQPATIAAPVAVARVEVAAPVAMLPIRELRKLAGGGVVKGASRMSQRELFEALRGLGKV